MNPFSVYVDVIKNNYSNCDGRVTRKEYWSFVLANVIVSFVIGVAAQFIGFPIIGSLYGLAVMMPNICLGVRRLHDTGRKGDWYWIVLTGIGAFVLIFFFCLDSQPGENKYGPNPKGIDSPDQDVSKSSNINKENNTSSVVSDHDIEGSRNLIPQRTLDEGNEETARENSIIPADSFMDEDGDEETFFLDDGEEDTMILEGDADDEETMPLFAFEPPKPEIYIIRNSDGERIDLKGSLFTIGSNSAKADYCITSNKKVSRNHATVYLNEESFYIKDNSKNGTFVNGEKLGSEESVHIKDGDTVALADEEFTVHIIQPSEK